MEKILVTTDFSSHSKSGLLFAVQLPARNGYYMTFLNVYRVQPGPACGEVGMDEYRKVERDLIYSRAIYLEKPNAIYPLQQ